MTEPLWKLETVAGPSGRVPQPIATVLSPMSLISPQNAVNLLSFPITCPRDSFYTSLGSQLANSSMRGIGYELGHWAWEVQLCPNWSSGVGQ